MYLPHTINEKTITLIVQNKPVPISASSPNFARIKALLISGRHDEVLPLLDTRKQIEKMGNGDLTITGNDVLFRGHSIPNYQKQKLLSMFRDGHKTIDPYKRMIERLEGNISFRAKEEFPRFADSQEFPITEDGYILAWRGLREDYYSVSGNTSTRVLKGKVDKGGHIYNGVGEEIEVERSDVDDNCNRTCSYGLHVGAFSYARSWSRGKVVLVKFDPKDVVSVPTDCNGQKCRVCHYWVVGEYTQETPIKESVVNKECKPAEIVKDNHTDAEYLAQFKKIVNLYDLGWQDEDVIRFEMGEVGFSNRSKIDALIQDLKIASKILAYSRKQGGAATFKKIQSALKAYSLKYADIQRLVNEYGDLV